MIKLLITFIEFFTARLHTEVDKLEAQAKAKTAAINLLIQQRMDVLDQAGAARKIANNISKIFD